MRLRTLLITFLKVLFTVAQDESVTEVTRYLGENVTLPSRADPSWNLSKVEWSVFSNNTWIATYRNGRVNIERFHLYKGRLSLNISTGDLTIQNINTKDAIEYSVDLFSTEGKVNLKKVKLIVKQHLQKPTIVSNLTKSIEGSCWVVLTCSSVDKGVALTWQVEPPGVTVYNTSDRAFLLAYLSTTQNHAKFTCTSSRNEENASEFITSKCEDDKPQPTPQPHPEPRNRHAGVFFGGVIVGGVVTGILIYVLKERNKTSSYNISEKMCPFKSSSPSGGSTNTKANEDQHHV